MFLTGAVREEICFPETNKLSWKLFHEKKIPQDQVPNAMKNYQMYGQTKGNEILPYQTLTYCERMIEGIVAEEVE